MICGRTALPVRNFLDLLYNTLKKVAEECLCQLHRPLANIMFLGSLTVDLGLHFVDKRRCHCAASIEIVHITETEQPIGICP